MVTNEAPFQGTHNVDSLTESTESRNVNAIENLNEVVNNHGNQIAVLQEELNSLIRTVQDLQDGIHGCVDVVESDMRTLRDDMGRNLNGLYVAAFALLIAFVNYFYNLKTELDRAINLSK